MGNLGSYISSRRVSSLDFSKTTFAASLSKHLYVWDITAQKSVLECGWSEWISSVQYSPHDSNLIGVTADKAVSVVDTRIASRDKNGVVWKASHGGLVSCMKWNPFIPYWSVSASLDGSCKTWVCPT